MQNHLSISE